MTKLQHVSNMLFIYGELCRAQQSARADEQQKIADVYRDASYVLAQYIESLAQQAIANEP